MGNRIKGPVYIGRATLKERLYVSVRNFFRWLFCETDFLVYCGWVFVLVGFAFAASIGMGV